MKTKLQVPAKTSVRTIFTYTFSASIALLVGLGTFFYFNVGSSAVSKADTTAELLLPIELISFEVKLTEEGKVDINWATAVEKDNDFFTLERSLDGQNFFVLDTLPSVGTSNKRLDYTYTDPSPIAGYNYYRLKQTHIDGKFEYFKVAAVVNDKAKPELSMISIGPNPYRDEFEVNFYSIDNNAVHLKLMDMEGKTIFIQSLETTKGHNSFTYVDENNLKPGIYLFSIVQKGTPAKTFRAIKSS